MLMAAFLVIAMTLTTFLTQRQLMSKNMPADALSGPYAQQQKLLLYVLPLVFAVGGEGQGGARPGQGCQARSGRTRRGGGAARGGASPRPASAAQEADARTAQEDRRQGRRPEVQGRQVMSDNATETVVAEESAAVEPEGPRQSRVDRLEQEGDIAADYLEELLDIADLDGDLDMDVEGDRAAVSIVGADLQQLVGRDGEVLEALQELTRLAVYRETGERSRLMLDISGYRARKREELEALAARSIAEVQASGEQVSLDPMTPFERKVVHDAVAAAGLVSESEGVEPRRHVVILPR
jgi:spoIIIJ-associated protein